MITKRDRARAKKHASILRYASAIIRQYDGTTKLSEEVWDLSVDLEEGSKPFIPIPRKKAKKKSLR